MFICLKDSLDGVICGVEMGGGRGQEAEGMTNIFD